MTSMWASAPAELIQELGLFLGTSEWAAARLVCRHWRAHITASVTVLELDLESSPHRWCMVCASVRRLFPRLKAVTLLVGTRVDAGAFAERMAELAMMVDLPELELRYVPIAFPRLGQALADVRGVTELRGLKALKLSGGPTPSVECMEALSSLRQLRELEVLPGDYGVLHGDVVPPVEGAESPVNYGLTDEHCAPLEALTALTSLLVKVRPEGFSAHGLASLTSLPELKSLVVYDAELPSSSLAVLSQATKLTALQVGVTDARSLRQLRALPQLQDLYLDTCSLDDIRALPTAAAAAGLPAAGPGALTGLYCVDQLFPTQEHISALSELPALRELVLEGPARALLHDPHNPWAAFGANGAAAAQLQQGQAAGGAGAAGAGQQQQQNLLMQWLNAAPPGVQLALLPAVAGIQVAAAGLQGQQGLLQAPLPQQQAPLPQQQQQQGVGGGGGFMQGGGGDGGSDSGSSDWEEAEEGEEEELGPGGIGIGIGGGGAVAAGGGAAAAAAVAALGGGGLQPYPSRAKLDLTPLSRLTALEVLQLDKREEGDEYDGVALVVSPSAVKALAAGWVALHTLDLYNITREELPAESVAEFTRLTALRSLSISACPQHAAATARRMGWWQLPSRLTGLGLTGFDLSVPGEEPWHSDPERMARHFGDLSSLRLHYCTLPPGFLPATAPALSDRLSSLSLCDVDGTAPEDIASIGQLTALSTLRLLPREHGLGPGGVAQLLPLRLKQLKLRLRHLHYSDLPAISRLTSVFVLVLTAPLLDDGEPPPGFHSEVRPSDVERAIADLPYCDVELEAEPSVGTAAA